MLVSCIQIKAELSGFCTDWLMGYDITSPTKGEGVAKKFKNLYVCASLMTRQENDALNKMTPLSPPIKEGARGGSV